MFSKIKNFLNIIMEHSYKVITKDADNNERICYFCTLYQISQYFSTMCSGVNVDVNIVRKLITKELTANSKRYENTAPSVLFKKFPFIEISCEKIVRYNETNCRKNKMYTVYRDNVKICQAFSVVELANRLKLSEATVYRIINGYYTDNAVTEKTKFLQKYRISAENITTNGDNQPSTETSAEGNLPFDVSI